LLTRAGAPKKKKKQGKKKGFWGGGGGEKGAFGGTNYTKYKKINNKLANFRGQDLANFRDQGAPFSDPPLVAGLTLEKCINLH